MYEDRFLSDISLKIKHKYNIKSRKLLKNNIPMYNIEVIFACL